MANTYKYLDESGLTHVHSLIDTNKKLTNGVEYIVGTQTGDTNAWTGVSTDIGCKNGTLYNGKVIIYHLPKAGTSSAATLNLTLPDGTTTGAKTIHRLASSTVTTTFASGCDILMVWNGTNWKVNAYVDTNSNTIGYQLRTNSALWTNKTGYSSNRYTLLFEVDGGLSGASTTIGTGTSKTPVNFKYIPGGVIKYYSTSGAIANNSDFSATGLWDVYTANLGYTFNTGTTLTAGEPVYMRCSVNSDGTLTPNYAGTPKHPIVQELPNTADGYVYVYLGQAYSTSNIELLYNHPIYEYKGGKLRLWQYDSSITSSDVTNALGYTPYNSSNPSGYISGITSSMVTTALGYTPYNSTNPNGYTSNTGTITGITMNGSSKGTSGVVDLGTVITSHQDISGKQDKLVSGTNIKTINNTSLLGSGNISLVTSSDLSSYALTSSLSTVATSGSYNDLSDKPTIPTVGNTKLWYGSSTTGSSTQTKVVTCSGFTLETGATIIVNFSNSNTIDSAKLNVNNTGAKTIINEYTSVVTSYHWQNGETVQFIYDGTYWVLINKANASTTYYGLTKLSSATNSTSTALAATPSAVKAAYDLAASKTDNIGTITGITMNGASKGTSGVVDLGTVLTSHQSIKTINNTTMTGTGNVSVQPTLVSGTNIKTINGTSILGSGDLSVSSATELTSNTNLWDLKSTGEYVVSGNNDIRLSVYKDNATDSFSLMPGSKIIINYKLTDYGGGDYTESWHYIILALSMEGNGNETYYGGMEFYNGELDYGDYYRGLTNWDLPEDTGWQTLELASGFNTSSGTIADTPQYKRVGSHVFVRGTITFTRSNTTQTFATMPGGCIPSKWVYKIACVQGTRLARIGVNPSSGACFIDWIYPTNSTTAVTSGTITWLDISMDFWTD